MLNIRQEFRSKIFYKWTPFMEISPAIGHPTSRSKTSQEIKKPFTYWQYYGVDLDGKPGDFTQ